MRNHEGLLFEAESCDSQLTVECPASHPSLWLASTAVLGLICLKGGPVLSFQSALSGLLGRTPSLRRRALPRGSPLVRPAFPLPFPVPLALRAHRQVVLASRPLFSPLPLVKTPFPRFICIKQQQSPEDVIYRKHARGAQVSP